MYMYMLLSHDTISLSRLASCCLYRRDRIETDKRPVSDPASP